MFSHGGQKQHIQQLIYTLQSFLVSQRWKNKLGNNAWDYFTNWLQWRGIVPRLCFIAVCFTLQAYDQLVSLWPQWGFISSGMSKDCHLCLDYSKFMKSVLLATSRNTFIFLLLTHFHKITKGKARRECSNNYTMHSKTKVAMQLELKSWLECCMLCKIVNSFLMLQGPDTI